MRILKTDEKIQWNTIIKSFPHWDIYYLCEYAVSLELHGDGEAHLIYFENDEIRFCYIMMKNDISTIKELHPVLESEKYYDFTTPYGYGGPLADGKCKEEDIEKFMAELKAYCKKQHIVTQFFRFHPLLGNQLFFGNKVCTVTKKQTIYMDLSSPELIFSNMDTKNRNMVRKAKKNEVTVFSDTGECLLDFVNIYRETMEMHGAQEYYLFDTQYFLYLIKNMKENIRFFYAVYQEHIVSAAIFLYNKKYMHYHLSGTRPEYRKLASNNLLLYEAALWGCAQGIEKLHLGGGICAGDSLFGFKKQFNKKGFLDFTIGKSIFDAEAYEELINLRKKQDSNFDEKAPFLIAYRA